MAKKKTTKKRKAVRKAKPKLDVSQNALRIVERVIGEKLKPRRH